MSFALIQDPNPGYDQLDTRVSSVISSQKDDDDKKDEGQFECNICLDVARDAVISLCGHLFCWPCLHQGHKSIGF